MPIIELNSHINRRECESGAYPPRVGALGEALATLTGLALRRFKSMKQAQRILGVHAEVYNLFNLCRHLVSADHYRLLRQGAFVVSGIREHFLSVVSTLVLSNSASLARAQQHKLMKF